LFNTTKKPFHDVRVRRALSMAIDRWGGAKSLSRVAFVRGVGGIIRPGSEFAAKQEELIEYPGFGTDVKAARSEAKRLLKDAGVRDLRFSITNRPIMPYSATAILLIDQWRQIGVDVEQLKLETEPYESSVKNRNYEAALFFNCDPSDEPNLQLAKYLSQNQTSLNYANYTDYVLDDLYEKQKRTPDKEVRYSLIRQFEQRVLQESYTVPVTW
jgi:peptide/nickel transport system substrate-binding protein